jgi:phenylalanyl-tRNA synthetase beta chain
MKVSLNWLGDHIDLAGLNTEEICELLTFSGIEVESVDTRGITSELLVVARIISSEPHPNADRLSVCQVDDGSCNPRQIVCGAKNYEVGDHVPLALPGASFGDFKIKQGMLRGVESMGMMCSGKEIGVGTDHDGLLILEGRPEAGTPIRDLFPSDTIFELEITPNRPDCLSHLGIARELHALTGRPLKKDLSQPAASGHTEIPDPTSEVPIRLSDSEGCPFYTLRRINAVTVKESPEWLKSRLQSVGLRPINNIVDITNFVLMEMGHPLHAFDQAKVEGGIDVRRSRSAEKITALDDEDYLLETDDLVIADRSKALAIAGIMGGAASGVSETTTDILLESAWFHPARIRQTSRRLGLSSDSSYRFERGADPSAARAASDIAVELICELAGGTPEPTIESAGSPPLPDSEVSLDPAFCSRVLGAPISGEEIATTLTRLGIEKAPRSELPEETDAPTLWRIPSFRNDLTRPIDLVEEVARIRGLDTIPSRNRGPAADPSRADIAYDAGMRLRKHLAARGFHECTTLKLIARTQLNDALGLGTRQGEVIALKNPLSEDHTHLRSSIVPGLLASLSHNLRHGSSDLCLFEVGTCFIDEAKRPAHSEIQQLAMAMTGKVSPPSWINPDPDTTTLHDLRGAIEALAPCSEVTFLAASHERFPLYATVSIDGSPVGLAAQVAPTRARELGFDQAVLVAELDLSILQKNRRSDFLIRDLPRYPSVVRDVAIEVPVEIPASDIDAFFRGQEDPLLADFRLFDVFTDPTGEKLPAGRRSLAYTLTYRDATATLRAEQVDNAHARILEALQRELPATIR